MFLAKNLTNMLTNPEYKLMKEQFLIASYIEWDNTRNKNIISGQNMNEIDIYFKRRIR